jgi:hypothetical protein
MSVSTLSCMPVEANATDAHAGSAAHQYAAASRRFAAAVEPFAGSVYFSPECHRNYAELGFQPSAREANGVALPDGPAYFTSRGSVMGHVPGEVVAAVFGVFNPKAVIPSVAYGWTLTDAPTIAQARADGAIAQLRRILGSHPDGMTTVLRALTNAAEVLEPSGRPLYAGVISQPEPSDDLGRTWWLADAMREFRGDCHTAAWIAAGLDAIEIGLLTELFLGLPIDSYIRTRAWSAEQIAAGRDRLIEQGLITPEGTFTDAGRAARAAIEDTTDLQMRAAFQSIGDDADEVITTLTGWGRLVRNSKGYLTSGADDLARQATQAR